MKRVDIEDRSSVRASLAKQCGFTGLSILHRLNCLYGFDVLLDTVYDAMHNIPLNVASHHLHYYLNEGLIGYSLRCHAQHTIECSQSSPALLLE